MNRVDIGDFGGADDPVGPQITVGALVSPDADGFVGELDMEGLNIGFGIDGERLDAQFPAGAYDAKGDFTAVSDEDFLNHQMITKSRCR